ncbi:Tic22 family protein [Gloeocapsa sp. BRSZ]
MKSIFRWGATLGILGSAVMSSALAGNLRALALPQEQVIQKLGSVPVFTITDSKGAPLVATPPQNAQNQNQQNQSPVAGVFISQKDAQAFVNNLKKTNPQLGNTVRVVPVPLGEVYKLEQANANQPNSLDIAYIPAKQQFDAALTLLRQSGSNSELRKACEQNKRRLEDCVGTPLFVARAGKEKGYLTMKINRPQANNQQAEVEVIPFYFNKEELQGMLDRFKKQQPELASTVDIQVLNLEGMLEILRTRNDEGVQQIVLVPPQESIQYVRSLQQSAAGQQAQPQRPAPQQAAPQRPAR